MTSRPLPLSIYFAQEIVRLKDELRACKTRLADADDQIRRLERDLADARHDLKMELLRKALAPKTNDPVSV